MSKDEMIRRMLWLPIGFVLLISMSAAFGDMNTTQAEVQPDMIVGSADDELAAIIDRLHVEEPTTVVEETVVVSVEEVGESENEWVDPGEVLVEKALEKRITEAEEEEVCEPSPEEVIEVVAEAEEYYPLYKVDGEMMDPDLQKFLWKELGIENIQWWMPYAMLCCYQESRFNRYDITNGLDYGLFQYRLEGWAEKCARYGYAGADVFNPYVQIVVYVKETARRLKEFGCSIEDTISRHMMSDYCGYNAKYVADVLGHKIEQIR